MELQYQGFANHEINYKAALGYLKYFFNEVFSIAFERIEAETFVPGAHLNDICDRLQFLSRTTTIGARMHSKSTGMYAKIAWEGLRLIEKPCEIFLVSSNTAMAEYHTEKAKRYMMELVDEGLLGDVYWTSPAKTIIELKHAISGYSLKVLPKGLFSKYRGAHPHIVVCEDMLGEPTERIESIELKKAERQFKSVISKLPRKDIGELHVMGNAQAADDLHYQLKDMRNPKTNEAIFDWKMYPAFLPGKTGVEPEPPIFDGAIVLWPEMYSHEDLLNEYAQGPNEFMTQFMCKPASFLDSFFRKTDFIDEERDLNICDSDDMEYLGGPCYIGYDPGKGKHPGHACLFEEVNGVLWQREDQWFEIGTEYKDQLATILEWHNRYDVAKCLWDDARAELTLEYERHELPYQMEPCPLNSLPRKNRVASAFKGAVQRKTVRLLPYETNGRQMEQILIVNNELKAPESTLGHGESFWTVGMACLAFGGQIEYNGDLNVSENPALTGVSDTDLWSKMNEGRDLFSIAKRLS